MVLYLDCPEFQLLQSGTGSVPDPLHGGRMRRTLQIGVAVVATVAALQPASAVKFAELQSQVAELRRKLDAAIESLR